MKLIGKIKSLEKWQKKRLYTCFFTVLLIGVSYLGGTLITLYNDRMNEDTYWKETLVEDSNANYEEYSDLTKNAVPITTGTYVENLRQIDLKTNTFRVEFVVWFRWQGDADIDIANHFRVYKGLINKKEIIKEVHEGNDHYQLVRIDTTVSKNFWTRRFPLESHQLRFYIESELTADKAILVADRENSGMNRSLSISGYELNKYAVSEYMNQYPNTQNDPSVSSPVTTSEMITQIEINRDSFGLYLKCFIALFGTTAWVLITLFIASYHHVDPLSMIPAALFGTVSNVMVGANLLPDALTTGLLEYVNFFGIMTILAVAFTIININRIRNKFENKEFSALFGKIMFYTILLIVVFGHVAYPLAAYMW